MRRGKKCGMAGVIRKEKQGKTALAKKLGVSRSSLYYQPKLPAKDLKLKAEIDGVMRDNKAYGHKRVAMALGINKKRARRVMKLFGLKRLRRRGAKPDKPADLNAPPQNIPNLIQGLAVSWFCQAWVVDFTYLRFWGRFVYLATVEDLFDRQIVGWAISTRHDAGLVTNAMLDAFGKHPAPGIVHSDQGSEYRSEEHMELLETANIKPSMSEKASPWQNGYKESFYSEFKLELGDPNACQTLGELTEAVAHQIYYYNHKRIHTALKCPPAVFAQRLNQTKNALVALTIINNNSAKIQKRVLV